MGIGADIALPVTRRTNARIGANLFNYNATFNKDDIAYKGSLALQSAHALFDFFPFRGGFHLSPGVMLYNGNNVNANASVPGNQTFTLNNVEYLSNPANPLTGTGKLTTSAAAPMFLLGYGNLVPRSHRHVTYSIEGGFAYQGTPNATLNFGGTVCNPSAPNYCISVADPTVQSNIQAEQTKIKNDVEPFKFYPVLSFGMGYKF
jgi:hypothetical protein